MGIKAGRFGGGAGIRLERRWWAAGIPVASQSFPVAANRFPVRATTIPGWSATGIAVQTFDLAGRFVDRHGRIGDASRGTGNSPSITAAGDGCASCFRVPAEEPNHWQDGRPA